MSTFAGTVATNILSLADELAVTAAEAKSGRAAQKTTGGPNTELTQTVIALAAGACLDEHENPGEATVHVLRGQATLGASGTTWDVGTGDIIEIPQARHYVSAAQDTVLILTSVKQRSQTHKT